MWQMVEQNMARQNQIRFKHLPDEVNKLSSLSECHINYIIIIIIIIVATIKGSAPVFIP